MIQNYSKQVFLTFVFLFSLLMCSFSVSGAPMYKGAEIQIIDQGLYKDLVSEFQFYSYCLDTIENGVPALIIESLPKDLHEIQSTQDKKAIFFKSLLPMVLLANKEIIVEREKLISINLHLSSQQPLSENQLLTLQLLASRYKVKNYIKQPLEATNELLKRIDIIPADLALAQAANESAWGTSRFSRLANNIFGEWTFIKGQGIVPKGRPAGATYEVQKFSTVYDSVRSYLNNLNTHSAYNHLRKLRTASRVAGKNLEGTQLAEGLISYSIRGTDYIKELQAMIRTNQLDRFAAAKLRTNS